MEKTNYTRKEKEREQYVRLSCSETNFSLWTMNLTTTSQLQYLFNPCHFMVHSKMLYDLRMNALQIENRPQY